MKRRKELAKRRSQENGSGNTNRWDMASQNKKKIAVKLSIGVLKTNCGAHFFQLETQESQWKTGKIIIEVE